MTEKRESINRVLTTSLALAMAGVLVISMATPALAASEATNLSIVDPSDMDNDNNYEVRSAESSEGATVVTVTVDVDSGSEATFIFDKDGDFSTTGDQGVHGSTDGKTVTDGGGDDKDGGENGQIKVDLKVDGGSVTFSEGDSFVLGVSQGSSVGSSPDQTFSKFEIDNTAPTVSSIETRDSGEAAGSALGGTTDDYIANANNGQIDQLVVTFDEPIDDYSVSEGDFSLSSGTLDAIKTGDTNHDNMLVFEIEESGSADTGDTPSLGYTQGFLGDIAGNRASDFSQTASDGAEPVVTDLEVTGSWNVDMTFSEGVYSASDGTGSLSDNEFEYTDTSGDGASSFTSAGHSEGSSEANFNLDPAIQNSDLKTDTIDISASTIYDSAGNAVSSTSETYDDANGDDVKPTISSIETGDGGEAAGSVLGGSDDHDATANNGQIDQLEVEFDENIDDSTVQGGDFTVNDGYSIDAIKTGSNENDQTIIVELEESGSSDTGTTPSIDISSGTLADDAGNTFDGVTDKSSTDGAKPTITGATTADQDNNGEIDQLQISFSETVSTTTPDAGTDGLTVGGSYAVDAIDSGDGTSTVTFSITESGIRDTGVTPDVEYSSGDGDDLTITGQGGLQVSSYGPTAASDGVAPVRTSVWYKDLNRDGKIDRIGVMYSETLSAGAEAADYTFGGTDSGVISSVDSAAVSGSTVELDVTAASVDTDPSLTLDYTATGGSSEKIEDDASTPNKAADFSGVSITDEARPVQTSIAYTDANDDGKIDRIDVGYSETLSSGAETADYTVGGTDSEVISSVESAAVSGSTVELDVTAASVDTEPSLTLDYTATGGSSEKIEDDASTPNQAGGFSGVSITDSAAPQITDFASEDSDANGQIDQFTVSFSEQIQSGSNLGQTDLLFDDVGDFAGASFGTGSDDAISSATSSVTIPLGTESTAKTTADSSGSLAISVDSGNGFSLTDGSNTYSNAGDATAHATYSDSAAPVATGATYKDTDADGQVDRVDVSYSEDISSSSVAASDWSVDTAGTINVQSVDSVTVKTTTFELSVTADPATTGGSTDPVVQYSGSSVADGNGNNAPTETITATDSAAPSITGAKTYDSGPDGDIDSITVTMSEAIDDSNSNIINGPDNHFSSSEGTVDSVGTGPSGDSDKLSLGVSGITGTGATPAITQEGGATPIEDLLGNSNTGSPSVTATDGAAPQANTPTLGSTTITESETGDTNEVTVTVSFGEDMTQNTGDVAVTPDVNSDLTTTPQVENERWSDAQTYKADLQFTDGDEAVTGVSLEVSGAKDAAGNVMISAVSTTYDVDTTAPSVSSFSASNPSSQDVTVNFDSDERLSTISVSIGGAESETLGDAEFTETDNGDGTYTYETTYSGSSDGEYTATLDTAEDAAANDGASGQSGTVTVDTTAPSVSSFSASNPSSQDVAVNFDSDEQLSTISVSISGVESASLSKSDFTETDNGDGTYTYEATYSGSSDGEYTATLDTAEDAAANDGASGETEGVSIETVNDVPIATDGTISTKAEEEARIAVFAYDPNGGSLTYSVASPPAHGTVTNRWKYYTYVPDPGFTGEETFVYEVTDPEGASDRGTVTVTVTESETSKESFDLSLGVSNVSVAINESLAVPVNATNPASGTQTQNVTMSVNGGVVAASSMTLGAGAAGSGTLTWDTVNVSSGNYTAVITAGATTESLSVSVTPPPGPRCGIDPPTIGSSQATDPDGDCRCENINGDRTANGSGVVDVGDVLALYRHLDSPAIQNNPSLFNFNGDTDANGTPVVDVMDVIALYSRL